MKKHDLQAFLDEFSSGDDIIDRSKIGQLHHD